MNDNKIFTKTDSGACPACGDEVPEYGYHDCSSGIRVFGDNITKNQINTSLDDEIDKILERLKKIEELLKSTLK